MNRIKWNAAVVLLALVALMASCKNKDANNDGIPDKFTVDTTKIGAFYQKHPDFAPYRAQVVALYQKHKNRYVWYDDSGRNDFAEVLFDKARQIGTEGVPVPLPYKDELEELFDRDRKKPKLDNELLISSMYFFYAKKVFEGIDPEKSRQVGWFLPREKTSYVAYLDELLKDEDLIKKDVDTNTELYYNLRKGLQKYRAISDQGGWGKITLPAGSKSLKVGDDSPAVLQLRKRLALTGDLKSDAGSTKFDAALQTAVMGYQKRINVKQNGIVSETIINELNVPVADRIRQIMVNMERCRWISPEMMDGKEYIAVNIPSYYLRYVRDGKTILESNVVVGKQMNETVVFSGKMSYLVFSPYWNIPKSIIRTEIEPGMAKDENYLEKHNMEWNNGHVRQKPGDDNSLGLIKFMFPNSNNIYLHDTPAKTLFNKDDRAFSHGCVRVEKARELAIKILDDNKLWTPEKIDEAMHSGVEKQLGLKRKIPVYIAYFTAVADPDGNVSFFDDVYKRDARLAHLLYSDES